jgi:hypothetical protein
VRTGAGIVTIVAGSGASFLVSLGLWRRIKPTVAAASLAACGALVGAGGMLVQRTSGPGDWAIALPVLAFFTPVHAWFVLGRPGVSPG